MVLIIMEIKVVKRRRILFSMLAHQSLVVPDTYQDETFLDTQLGAPVCPINAISTGSSYPADSCIIISEGYAMKMTKSVLFLICPLYLHRSVELLMKCSTRKKVTTAQV